MDRCIEENSACCCNNIAFALSMLCINCQSGGGSPVPNTWYTTGLGGPSGTYQTYLGACSPNVNTSFPTEIQEAVCEKKIKIADDLYTIWWPSGAWYYDYLREHMEEDFAANNNNTFTHCPSTTLNATSSISAQASATDTTSPGSTSTASTKSSSLSGGATAAVAVGAVVALALAGFVIWFCHRRHRGSVAAIRQITARQMAHVGY
ncbi:hypothetical protein FIBSPDRAFT_850840 [Athelia psychrophila]|uniref:Uncharacterized protein n=1 Tax=Athelia psychrophila TaxID=1759441 RepID=A0A166T2R5_9AGAM|nr:hypothetical protein FIBSPDRAFT_850840 [Fibularhizoctonia sp. CBS 109695]